MRDAKSIGARIKALRVQAGISTTRLGELIGVAQSTVSGWESGRHAASVEVLEKIASALDVPLAKLMDVDGDIVSTERLVGHMAFRERQEMGMRIAEVRNQMRWPQSELARRVGIDQATLSKIESGQRQPTARQAARLMRVCGVDVFGFEPKKRIDELVKHVPAVWPKGMAEYVESEAFKRRKIEPIQVPLLAAMASSEYYWRPQNQEQWDDLGETLKDEFGHIGMRLMLMES